MKSFRQKIIENDLKQGKTVANNAKKDDYVTAIFMIDKKGGFDREGIDAPESELQKEYKFKIHKDKLGNVIDTLRNIPGVTIQTKTDVKKSEGAPKVMPLDISEV